MSSESPMLRRMRSSQLFQRFKFPKKGRIRFVLVLIAVVAGFKVCGALFKSESGGTKSKGEIGSNSQLKKTIRKDVLTFSDLSELLKNHSPTYSNEEWITNNSDSLDVHYSIDTSLQNFGLRLLKQYHPRYGALVALEPKSGRVLAMISYTNDTVPDLGSDLYIKCVFPAASVFKTVTAAAAIERANYTAQSLVQHVGRKSTLYRYQLEKELRNYVEIPLEEAYAHSINPVFARLGMYTLGKNLLDEYEQRFGFGTQVPFELHNGIPQVAQLDSLCTIAELASGFNQKTTISPLFGALIAASISEQGKMPRPTLVDSITRKGTSIYNAVPQVWREPIKPSTSKELREMMNCVARYGTAHKSFRYIRQSSRFDNIEYGGKTGSVDKDGAGRVDWFIGFARDPNDSEQHISIGVVTVHGQNWTVHSSFIGAEIFRVYLRSIQLAKEKIEKQKVAAKSDSLSRSQNSRVNM
jgi:peptidoglycan glycosyltransferase